MKTRIQRVDFVTRIPVDLDIEVRQYVGSRPDTTFQSFTEEAFRRHLKHLRRRESKNVVDIAPERQKRTEQPGGRPSLPPRITT
jgi:hypothetical protein